MARISGEASAEHWPINMTLPDGQRLAVRLYERAKDREGPWMYRVGVPMWQCAGGPHIEAKEYTTWVIADVLEPIDSVDLTQVPKHRILPDLPPPRPGWVHAPGPGGRGVLIHGHDCAHATGGGIDMDTLQALDALMRPGVRACHHCDAAAILGAALQLGHGHAPV
ncbi:DUF6233 domain-containing protein (plasmid) [Streptomyces sp. NBC_00868]|uniref:DUF6233 domain-containing protein n=1 Tax=Streptomyces sp. NBC_00868 TaxID=2903683 RepID=UPI002F90FA58|nr:DUF6233 domain-containing protein [Streptomyces sp. NBC_00868]